MVAGAVVLLVTSIFARDLVPWLLPVALPAIGAPLLIAATSRGISNGRKPVLFVTGSETAPAPVIVEQQRIFLSWTQQGPALPEPASLGAAPIHV